MNEILKCIKLLFDCVSQAFAYITALFELFAPPDLVHEEGFYESRLPFTTDLTNVFLIIKVFQSLSRRKSLSFALLKPQNKKWLIQAILLQILNSPSFLAHELSTGC
jgi:hypothetical protein